MGFVQTAFFGAFAALAIPVIVHLMFRMRTRRVDLGTVRFLREVLQKNARRKKVKRFVLLALRMACVAMLAALFARPYFIEQAIGSADRLVTILIDRSASMELRSGGDRLLDQAVDQAKALVKESGKSTRVEVAFFDHTVRPVGADAASGTAGDVISGLIAPEVTFCSTDFGAAFSWARDVCVKAGPAEKELHVFTDLQRSGLDWSEVVAMPDDVSVELHDMGRDSPNNVAVTSVAANRTLIRPGDVATVSVTVSNAGPFPLKEVPLRLYLRSNRRTFTEDKKVSIASGGLGPFEFQVEGLEPGLWQGQVEIEIEDELRFDNKRFLALMSAPPWKVLIVDGQPHESPILSETYFLETALRLAPPGQTYANTPYDPQVVSTSEFSSLEFDDYELVVLANVEHVSSDSAKRLGAFVTAGGGLVVFSGENIESEGYRSLQSIGLAPGRFVDIKESDDLPWRMRDWDEGHSIFAPFNDPQHGDLRRLAFHAYTKIERAAEANVLASFRGGDPLLLEVAKGEGRALWFTSSCDRQWSDWPRSRLYVPFLHQMLGHLTGLNEGGPVRGLTIDASNNLAADIKPGVYERARHWEVINPSPRESETDRCTPVEFSDRFALHVGGRDSSADQMVAAVVPTTVELRDDEIWHWMVFALVSVLCVESFLANRTTA
jgi:uncharacterized membrane protein